MDGCRQRRRFLAEVACSKLDRDVINIWTGSVKPNGHSAASSGRRVLFKSRAAYDLTIRRLINTVASIELKQRAEVARSY